MLDDPKKLIDEQIKELALANYDGQIQSLAVVYVNQKNDMKVLLTIAPNMSLAMVGATSLLDFEVKSQVKTQFSKGI